MASYVAIQRSMHQNAGYSPVVDLSFAAEMTTVPLLEEELSHAIQFMCVAFQKRASVEGDVYELVCLQSFKPDTNLFLLPNGRWLGGYKPAFYRSYPFALQPNNDSGHLELCIKSDCINFESSDNDLAFFEKDLSLTPRLQGLVKFLSDTVQNRNETLALCKALQEADLIVPWIIRFTEQDESGNPQTRELEGLYRIDGKALKVLSSDKLASLNKTGALRLAYGQQFSESRLRDLSTLNTTYQKLVEQQSRQNVPVPEPDLDKLFGDDDGLFSF